MLLAPSGVGASSATSTTTPAPATTPAATTSKPATTPATPAAAATTATATTGNWTVLVSSFATKPEATKQLAQLRKLGFKHFHVVHVGTQYVVRERHLHHTTATKLVARLKAAGVSATESK